MLFNKETPANRRKRFKAMSSIDRKDLIRKKMKEAGLEEGSGVKGKIPSEYDKDEILDLIRITKCFPEISKKKD